MMQGLKYGLLCAVALAAPVTAADQRSLSAEPSMVDPARLNAALELLDAMNYEEQLIASIKTAGERMVQHTLEQSEVEQGITLPAPLRAEMERIIAEELAEATAELIDTTPPQVAAIYASNFTAEELRTLAQFQAHPVMRKFNERSPEMMAEIMIVTQPVTKKLQEKALVRILDAVSRHFDAENTSNPGTGS